MDSENEKELSRNEHILNTFLNNALKGGFAYDTNIFNTDQINNNFNATDHANFNTEHTNFNMDHTGDDANLTLGHLFLKYRELEFRIGRIEAALQREDSGFGRGGGKRQRISKTGYNGTSFEGALGLPPQTQSSSSPSSSPTVTSINPILTSDILSMNNNNFQGSGSSIYSLPPSSASVSPSKVRRKEEIKRSDLDYYCSPLLETNPKPTTDLMQIIVNIIHPIYPNIDNKQLLSKVREWFRKKREYMSQRIFQICAEAFKDLRIESESDLDATISDLDQRPETILMILGRAELEIQDETVARSFCHEKIISFFNSLYKPGLRNRA